MWSVFVATIGVMFVGYLTTLQADYAPTQTRTETVADAVAANMLIHNQAAVRYAIENPTYVGVLAPTAIGLPAWYNSFGWQSDVSASGIVRTYGVPSAGAVGKVTRRQWASVTARLTERMERRFFVGIVSSNTPGEFNSSCITLNDAGNTCDGSSVVALTALALSAGLPTGSILIATQVHL